LTSPNPFGACRPLYSRVEGAGVLPRNVRSKGLLAGVIRNPPLAGWRDVTLRDLSNFRIARSAYR
jgi:hypothetical protein